MSATPEPDHAAGTVGNKRRSGRVSRKPDIFTHTSPYNNTKRKRSNAEDDEQDDAEGDDADSSASSDQDEEQEDEPAEEERRDKARRARSAPKKPAAKKAKATGSVVNIPIRSTAGKARRPKKAKALDTEAAEDAGGLYAEVFARGHTLDAVAVDWLKTFDAHQSEAVADLINFVLRCAGCELEITNHDIDDPDGCTNKLTDLQEEFQAQNVTEYPIVAKGKGTAAFKASVTGFFHTLIKAINAAGLLLPNIELLENLQVWLSGMSAAQNRPFRHTATVVSLSIITALCEVGRDLLNTSAKSFRHSESERKKKTANKRRVSALQDEAKDAQQIQEQLHTVVKDWFDTIFIHRYRDVDPRIRVDCVQALGEWILTYPDIFFDGSHLRYLGWVLSDSHAPARHEVVRQLLRLYKDKDKLPGLKTFTERFRARMVEMATLDSEIGVRTAAVDLLDILREAGLLEPDDVDSVGRLIFDAEPRVRKAVVGFFAESINDSYESKIEELGGQEALEESLPEGGVENPCLEWLKLKCLAEMLDSYDTDGHVSQITRSHNLQLHTATVESRFIVAADSLYSSIPEVQQWEALAGYLLYDSSDGGQNGLADDVEAQLKVLVKLNEKEEIILLEVLNSSIKGEIVRLTDAASERKGKKSKKQREDLVEEQEHAARHLANLVPRLLKKFGEAPQTASTILRLERVVNLEAFHEFRQDSSTYATLLDDINRQFMTHGDDEVLAEASRALLRAKDYHELGDVTEERIETLWEDTLATLTTLTTNQDLTTRANLPSNVLDALTKTVMRIERLTTISRPIEHLESTMTLPKSRKSQSQSQPDQPSTPLETLISLIHRAVPFANQHEEDATDAHLEDSLAQHAASAVSFYFLWTISTLKTSLETSGNSLSDAALDSLALNRDAYISALTAVLESRAPTDDVAIAFAGLLLDAHTVMATLRHVRPAGQPERDDFLVLALEMDPALQASVLAVFAAAEAAFARKSGRALESVARDAVVTERAVDAEPLDEDEAASPVADDDDVDEDGADDEEADAEASQVRRIGKLQAQLVAEQRLCELTAKIVLAVLGGMMDAEATRKRVERNKTRLGANFKEVVGHLDAVLKAGPGGKGRKKAIPKGKAKSVVAAKQSKKSKDVVVEDDEDDEEELDEDGDDEEALRRRELVDEHDEDDDGDEQMQEQEQEVESVLGD